MLVSVLLDAVGDSFCVTPMSAVLLQVLPAVVGEVAVGDRLEVAVLLQLMSAVSGKVSVGDRLVLAVLLQLILAAVGEVNDDDRMGLEQVGSSCELV